MPHYTTAANFYDNAWQAWVTTASTTSTCTTVAWHNSWQEWYIPQVGTSASTAWVAWTVNSTTAQTAVIDWQYVQFATQRLRAADPAQQQEQREQLRLAAIQRAVRHAEQKAARRTARRKARRLLLRLLDPAQVVQFRRTRSFRITAVSGRVYELALGYIGNVSVLNAAGQTLERLCIHTDAGMPEEDNLVAQKLLLESDEQRFRTIANITRLPLRPAAQVIEIAAAAG